MMRVLRERMNDQIYLTTRIIFERWICLWIVNKVEDRRTECYNNSIDD